MIINFEVQEIPERGKYHTYWRLHLIMLPNTTKKVFAHQNINSNNTSAVG